MSSCVVRCNPAVLILAVLTLVAPASVEAATFTVDSTLDTTDVSPGDGVCADSGGRCTLRAAIMEANALPSQDRIDVPAGEYFPTIASLGSGDGHASGDFNITDSVELYGAGADQTFIGPELVDVANHRVLAISDLGGRYTLKASRFATVPTPRGAVSSSRAGDSRRSLNDLRHDDGRGGIAPKREERQEWEEREEF